MADSRNVLAYMALILRRMDELVSKISGDRYQVERAMRQAQTLTRTLELLLAHAASTRWQQRFISLSPVMVLAGQFSHGRILGQHYRSVHQVQPRFSDPVR